MKKATPALILALIICLFTPTAAAADTSSLQDWIGTVRSLPPDELIERADTYSDRYFDYEKALLCLSLVADRYSPDMTVEDKLRCVSALNRQFNIYNGVFGDATHSWETLNRASSILKETGRRDALLEANFGSYYADAYYIASDTLYRDKAYHRFKDAFDIALNNDDTEILDFVVPNMVDFATPAQRADELPDLLRQYRTKRSNRPLTNDFNLLLIDGHEAMATKDWGRAEDIFRHQAAMLPRTYDMLQSRALAYLWLSRTLVKQGRMSEAIATLDSVSQLCRHNNHMLMWEINTNAELAQLHRLNGDSALADRITLETLIRKDSVLNERMMINVRTLEMIEDNNKRAHTIEQLSSHRRFLIWGAVILLVMLAAAVAMITVVIKRMKTLKALQQLHYRNLTGAMFPTNTGRSANESAGADATADTGAGQDNDTTPADAALWDTVSRVLSESPEVYDPGFKLSRLAELAGSNVKYVSTCINRNTGLTFPTLVSNFRIKEACRRLREEPEYSNRSLESLAMDVGIKSRTTFNNAFKRVTGMTASEYARLSRNEMP